MSHKWSKTLLTPGAADGSVQLQRNLQRLCEEKKKKKSPQTGAVSLCLLADRNNVSSLVRLQIWLLMELKWEAKRKPEPASLLRPQLVRPVFVSTGDVI